MPDPRRGEIVRVRLDPVGGSGQAGGRPVPVLSPDLISQHSPVILVAAITSKRTDRVFPFEALIEPPDGGLTMRSKVMLMQLRAIDKSRLLGYCGAVSEETLKAVEGALKIATGLTPT